MNAPCRDLHEVKRNARAAAECGDLPSSCPYLPGSAEEYHWKDAYYIRMYELSGEESA